MSLIDSDSQVRMQCFGICCELLKLGFLDDDDTKLVIENYPFKDNAKVHVEVAKFIFILNKESSSSLHDQYKLFLDTYKPDQLHDDLVNCLSIKA